MKAGSHYRATVFKKQIAHRESTRSLRWRDGVMKMRITRNISDPYVLAGYYTLRIVLIYVVFAGLWILFSDQAMALIFTDIKSITIISMIKGWVFVAVTGLLLFFLIRRLVAGTVLRETKLNTLFQTIPDLIWLKDTQGVFITCNKAFLTFFGLTEKDIIGHNGNNLIEHVMKGYAVEKDKEAIMSNTPILSRETMMSKQDGKERFFSAIRTPMVDARGSIIGVLGIARDITDQVRLDEERQNLHAQLLQAQKMESVGRLAGGVAHDFNNMLTVILGYAGIAMKKVELDNNLRCYLEEILKAGQHSADLTRQLLAFARKQTALPKVLDLNDTVAGMLKMLQRLIGEDINLAWHPGYNLWRIKADPSQIDQVLANLVVNARDAINGSGNIIIKTGNVFLDEDHCGIHSGLQVGKKYVLLEVTDDGIGMEKTMLEQIFEPFFTTKAPDKGTGLGLSTVYGIVTQNAGFIDTHSEVGKGTTFKIYLPKYEGDDDNAYVETISSKPQKGTVTVLLVEDSAQTLEVGKTMLDSLGHTVLSAASPSEAIRMAKEHVGVIDILMTDIIMPEMDGWELSRQIKALRPNIKPLFMSGYGTNVTGSTDELHNRVFMQKPFSLEELTEKIQQALNNELNQN